MVNRPHWMLTTSFRVTSSCYKAGYFIIFLLAWGLASHSHATEKKHSRDLLSYEDREKWNALYDRHTVTHDISNTLSIDLVQLDHEDRKAPLYFWVGDTAEPNDALSMALTELNKHGHVWFMHTPEALFIDSTRQNLRNEMGQWMPEILSYLSRQFEHFYLVAGDVAAIPVSRGLHHWQTTESRSNHLKGFVLLYPNYYTHAPIAGEAPSSYPILHHTAAPIHILQPELGAQAQTISDTIRALRQGGSLVEMTRIPEAADWYFFYENIETMAPKTGKLIANAAESIHQKASQIGYQLPKVFKQAILANPPSSQIIAGLQKMTPPYPMANIQLKDMTGKMIDLHKDYQGKALLVNFWATWCPHCVEEIPSMNNALKQLPADKFEMVSISYKDTQAILDEFIKDIPVDFPIMMDLDGQVSADWKVFAFPSSFLVNSKGEIVYSINSGSIWDTPEMIDVMQSLIVE